MDELELLKKDWKKQEEKLPRLSYNEIYQMLWKRSSSIVKWIFIISFLEFLFWAVLTIFFADNQYWQEMEQIRLKGFMIGSYIVNYSVTFFFIYRFYNNYRKISSTDNAAQLIKSILKTRKTVKYYIGYVIISTALITIIYTYFMINYHIATTEAEVVSAYTFSPIQWLLFSSGVMLTLAVFLGLVWLFYRLLYGILLKRLNKNYKELKKLGV